MQTVAGCRSSWAVPLTVVVPNSSSRADVIRALSLGGGVANLRVETLGSLVERIAGAKLSPRVRLSRATIAATVDSALATDPGLFAEVAEQLITAEALAAACWEIAHLNTNTMTAPTTLAGEVLRIFDAAVASLTAEYYVPSEAYRAAIDNLEQLGEVIVYGPTPSTPRDALLVHALAARGSVIEASSPEFGTQVIHASDADDEVRAVARLVRQHLADGTPAHRIAIHYGSAEPYLRLLHEHLAAAGVVINGPDAEGLADRPVARALRTLLRFDPDDIPRRELLDVLSERTLTQPPLADGMMGQPLVERLTRKKVPIVRGDDWERLAPGRVEGSHASAAEALHAWVTDLRHHLAEIHQAASWTEASTALSGLIDAMFRPPTDELAVRDLEAIRSLIADLTQIEGIAPAPTAGRIADAVDTRVRSHIGRVGTRGVGVSIGPLSDGVGRDLAVSIIVGAAEGIIPTRRTPNPLLPPEVTGITPADDIAYQRAVFERTLAAGEHHRVITFPRGSLRGGAEKVPSRWLLPTLEHLAGHPVGITSWGDDTRGVDAIVTVESFDSAVQSIDPRLGCSAASATEWRQRALAVVPAHERRGVIDDPTVTLGMTMRSDRLHGRFTRFNGNVSAVADLIRVLDEPIAATTLQDWVASPYRLFLTKVLCVDVLADPDADPQIDALTSGNLIHRTLEKYIQERIDGDEPSLERLLTLADAELARERDDSPGWLAQLWDRDRARIRADIEDFYDHDLADHNTGWGPHSVERKFDALELLLPGAPITLRGSVDRIDLRDGAVRVTDYKSGSPTPYSGITAGTPTDEGTKFQLPIYAHAARDLGAPVDTRYWFITRKGGFEEVGYRIDDAVQDILVEDLRLVCDAIRAGYFPPKPVDSHWGDDLLELIGIAGLRRSWTNLDDVDEIAEYTAKYGK
ncbi:PD-(D/E)XK nuclease superfamily protein [Williamsia sterculiae]|uniref:PD-(D/E)XK nuclease superfamily protein n=2 Tax=Williamsia sterculiae TaxID=1344003 RepID=A0A1N7HB54_9NOCA|nr:PD-(D/E)XK nuclease superfamily protein [Williamsia sterculiae]